MTYMFRTISASPAERKIESFAALPVGWHYGEGGPIAREVLDRAQMALQSLFLAGLTDANAFAGEGGEVLVTAYTDAYNVGVIVEPDGTFSIRLEMGAEDVSYDEHLDARHIRESITSVAEFIWNTSGYSIRQSSTTNSGDSTISPSRERVMVSPSFREHALAV